MAAEMALVRGAFEGLRKIVVPEGEEPAANVLRVSDVAFASAYYSQRADQPSDAPPTLIARHGEYFRSKIDAWHAKMLDAGLFIVLGPGSRPRCWLKNRAGQSRCARILPTISRRLL
ncbi:MAG: hypothetical protein E5X61_24570, partial [Mesorhizobium sp.]